MAVDQKDKYRDMVIRGKYQRLYSYLSSLQVSEWRTSFNEVEAVIGFELPTDRDGCTGPGGAIREAGTDTATPLPGASLDGRRRRLTWTPRRCCSDRRTPSLYPGFPSTRHGPSTPRQCGRKA